MKVSEKRHIGYFSVHICRHVGEVYFECHIALLLGVVRKPDGGCGAVAELVFNNVAVVVEFVTKMDGVEAAQPVVLIILEWEYYIGGSWWCAGGWRWRRYLVAVEA